MVPLPKERIYTEQDYNNLPEDVRAELIEGSIYYQAAPSRIHQEILENLYTIINNYIHSKGGLCKVYPAPFAVKFKEDSQTIVEPDISVICDMDKLTDKGCTGAPDWIIEIVSPGNSGHDYIKKLNLYADMGVREYWIVNPIVKSLLVYYFDETNIDPKSYSFKDKVKVNIYDEFYIDFSALLYE
jgi:Uncharacterized protein conserved in cyanobacteria